MQDKLFIHLFKTSIGNYFYDVNTNKIIHISPELYNHLEKSDNDSELAEVVKEEKDKLKKAGYLKNKHVLISEHLETDLLPYYYQNKVNYLILQITQNCNLRCEYCIYSGNYKTRTHSGKIMTWNIAKKGLDFLLNHSKNEYELTLGFYGGEPLLNFPLIKKCIEYMEKNSIGKKCRYVMTTNLTLLNEEIAAYVIDKKFILTVSIDGPKEVHNKSRRFVSSNLGSFDTVIKNLKLLYEKNAEYYRKNIQFSTVMTTKDGFDKINVFFMGNDLFKNADFNAVIVSNIYSKEKIKVQEKFMIERRYSILKMFLEKLGFCSEEETKSISNDEINELIDIYSRVEKLSYQEIPERWHHGGPCVPGIKRLFLNTDGNFYPCEKVCENDQNAVIGDIENGISIEKAKKMMNIEQLMANKCRNCWAYAYCKICVMQILDAKLSALGFEECMKIKCDSIRQMVENAMKDYTVVVDSVFK